MHPIKSLFAPESAPVHIHFPVLAGNSVVAHATQQMVQLAATVIDPLVILGPEGSGKAAIAHAVHMLSQLADNSFLSFDCTEITDADHHKILAQGMDWPTENFQGTIYLDEIGLLPAELQSAMCTWIDMNTLRERPIRLIAASRHPLDELVAKGQFDPLLFGVMDKLIIPTLPLSRRKQDIQALIAAIWANNHIALPPSLSRSAWQLLEAHSWIGNFAELQRIAQLIAAAHGGKRVGPDHIKRLLSLRAFRHIAHKGPDANRNARHSRLNLRAHLEREEAIMLMVAFERGGGMVQKAAKLAGIDRATFREKMQRYGIAHT